MENGFFVVSFTNQEDYLVALQGGPWVITDHYLLVQRWRPNFSLLNSEEPTKIAIWIRNTNLPLEFYNGRFLFKIGSLIGKTLKLDLETSITTRGKFARICVEIKLGRKLKPMIEVKGRRYNVEYEGLHLIYFTCGKYGHTQNFCMKGGKNKDGEREAQARIEGEAAPYGNPRSTGGFNVLRNVGEEIENRDQNRRRGPGPRPTNDQEPQPGKGRGPSHIKRGKKGELERRFVKELQPSDAPPPKPLEAKAMDEDPKG
ncbi:uncharacterized protein G2W53_029099 [Senna tora]|uniref:DUF4283 domain-containing protein n=1 Tax=Senna tora TaxID=362788 RepID=A0A834T539_9FABA|nr:uncharacterized protein G2W53_029099 [Senna tora]